MATIHKFELQITDLQHVEMPDGASALAVGEQRTGRLVLWAKVDPAKPLRTYAVRIYGTGHPIEDKDDKAFWYVGTVRTESGLVWHVCFEMSERQKATFAAHSP